MSTKIQAVKFQREQYGPFEYGVAFLETDFDCYNIKFIVNDNGNKVSCFQTWIYEFLPHYPGQLTTIELP